MVPNERPPTATATTKAPSQSNLPVALSSRLSRTKVSVAHTARTQRGTLIRNATRQDTASTSAPPRNGPRIVVAADAPAQSPNARPCASPLNVAVRSATDPGTSNAPAAPCRTRKTLRSYIDGATPQTRLVT